MSKTIKDKKEYIPGICYHFITGLGALLLGIGTFIIGIGAL